MSDDTYARNRYDTRDTTQRLRAYLMTRSSECWLFFFAGIVAGALLG
jgi:hypothetical protein